MIYIYIPTSQKKSGYQTKQKSPYPPKEGRVGDTEVYAVSGNLKNRQLQVTQPSKTAVKKTLPQNLIWIHFTVPSRTGPRRNKCPISFRSKHICTSWELSIHTQPLPPSLPDTVEGAQKCPPSLQEQHVFLKPVKDAISQFPLSLTSTHLSHVFS